MWKKTGILITLCLVGVVILLSSLYHLAPMPNRQGNGFDRKFMTFNLREVNHKEYEVEIVKISGISKNAFYFSGKDPSWVLISDSTLTPVDTALFGVRRTNLFLSANTVVDSPNVYMYAGNISYFIKGKLGKPEVDTVHLKTPVFTRSVQISPQLLLIRGYDESQMRQVFRLMDAKSGVVLKEKAITEDNADLGISNDGFLRYDQLSGKIIYLQLFQNRFYCIDTGLNVLYTAHTIDTTANINVPLEKIKSGNAFKVMPKKGLNVINSTCAIQNGFLFVLSTLKADNEQMNNFNRNYPIDIYKIEDGKYIGSIYMPKIHGNKIRDIAVYKTRLIALYENGIVILYNLELAMK